MWEIPRASCSVRKVEGVAVAVRIMERTEGVMFVTVGKETFERAALSSGSIGGLRDGDAMMEVMESI